jgi:high-affinity iron transporter
MDFSSALPTFVITLREGVEATLVVGIVLACLKKAKQTQLNSWVYAAVATGIIASALVGLFLGWLGQLLTNSNQSYAPVMEPLLEGSFAIVAIAMLSWMLIWMTQQARKMKGQVEGAIAATLNQNTTSLESAGWGVFTLIFVAVLREGFETVLFVLSSFQQGFMSAIGAFGGLAAATGIGVMLFKWGIKINIRRFFQWMGILLLAIVAGLVVTALKNFDEALNILSQMNRESASLCFYYERFSKEHSCVLGSMVWNTSSILPDDQFPGIVLKSLFGYRAKLYLVQAVSYLTFLITVGGIYFRSLASQSPVAAKSSTASGN